MQSASVFLNIAKIAYFRQGNAKISRTQGVCHMIHVFVRARLYKTSSNTISQKLIALSDTYF